MIKGEYIGYDAIQRRFKDQADRIPMGLTRAVTRLTLMLLRDVKENKLTGQVLNVRSGRLRRSINSRMEGEGTNEVKGTVGTNLVYGRPHEYGFSGTVQVREHLRTIVQAFGKPIGPVQVTVKAHKMTMKLPEKSFLRSALRDLEPRIDDELRKASNYIAKG